VIEKDNDQNDQNILSNEKKNIFWIKKYLFTLKKNKYYPNRADSNLDPFQFLNDHVEPTESLLIISNIIDVSKIPKLQEKYNIVQSFILILVRNCFVNIIMLNPKKKVKNSTSPTKSESERNTMISKM
jgi:hypothetical protein